jgi:4-diphosphocytidyl-2-C-methyl-D-erythritol kinase
MKYAARPLVIKSFAKLNLYLQVLNKRKDGFHNLSTLFARINLADRLTFRKRTDGQIKIKCTSRQVPKDKTNLCYRAAVLLKQEFKLSLGIEIELNKHIPVGAGLGGGSADAAGVLLGLNKVWDLNLPKEKLLELGGRLGSDVPFFIYQVKFALGSHRGDKINPVVYLNKLKLWFILVYPGFSVSTPLIYKKFDAYFSTGRSFSQLTPHLMQNLASKEVNIKQGAGLTRPDRNVKILTSELRKRGKAVDGQYFFNGLEAITSKLYPAVNQVKNSLFGLGLNKVIMSGSGPTVFAVCDSGIQARRISSNLHKQHPSWEIFVTSTI